MISRRNFMIAGGSAMVALSLGGAATAKAGQRDDLLTITSASYTLARAEQGDRHIVLSGDRLKDIATLEQVFGQVGEKQITLFVDAADLVLLDIALTNVTSPYVSVAVANGTYSYRRTSFVGA